MHVPRLAAAALAALALACAHARDPVSRDPARPDPQHPPALVEAAISSHGTALPAIVYTADGPGPHPTAIFLHGLPGNERNLDLAQAARRAGWNAVFFHYRGAWGSPGDYSFRNVLEDVASAVDWVRSPERDAGLRIDPGRIALVGHSLGGFAALRAGAELESVGCIASLAGADLAARGRAAREDPELRAAVAAALDALTGPLRGTSGAALAAEAAESAREFDVLRRTPALAGRPLLLVAGTRDTATPPAGNHDPLVGTLEALAPVSLTAVVLDADHAFSTHRVALARVLVRWLDGACLQSFENASAQ